MLLCSTDSLNKGEQFTIKAASEPHKEVQKYVLCYGSPKMEISKLQTIVINGAIVKVGAFIKPHSEVAIASEVKQIAH